METKSLAVAFDRAWLNARTYDLEPVLGVGCDLAECEGYGEQVQLETGVAKGAVAGGAVGAASGAILGNAGTGAGLGAIGGASRSAQIWEREHARVVKNCLRVRGYRVLN